jgi:2-polyprenyl-6-hydroxyphenyl methylase/3-demethylubiquinone-9 3-methyltransferase
VVEHVTDVPAFLVAIRTLVAPGGLLVFSTPNRTALSWGVLIGGAERMLKLIPDGGHDWTQFLTPDELTAKLAAAGLRVERLSGLSWSPLRGFHLSPDQRVNYIGTATPV